MLRLRNCWAAADAGAAISEQTDAGWQQVAALNLRSPLDCARLADGDFFVAGQGAVARVNASGFTLEVPDTAALGRQASLEPWIRADGDGASLFVGSARGAAAVRGADGGWRVAEALPGEISALAVESASEAWVVGTGLGLARFDGAVWRPAGAGPALLSSFDALALEGAHVYVGGRDAAGVARVFRRLR